MRVDGVPQLFNVSRSPGVYAQLIPPEYSTNPVEPAPRVSPRVHESERLAGLSRVDQNIRTEDLIAARRDVQAARQQGERLREEREQPVAYRNLSFGRPEGADRGLFLDILG